MSAPGTHGYHDAFGDLVFERPGKWGPCQLRWDSGVWSYEAYIHGGSKLYRLADEVPPATTEAEARAIGMAWALAGRDHQLPLFETA